WRGGGSGWKFEGGDWEGGRGAGMGWSGHLPAFDHRRSPGGNWPFLGGVLCWLGHGRGSPVVEGADPTAFGDGAVSPTGEFRPRRRTPNRKDPANDAASNLAQRRVGSNPRFIRASMVHPRCA